MKTGVGRARRWKTLSVPVVVALVLAVVAAALLVRALWSVALHTAIWTWWCLRGRDVLFVYSDSPLWRDHLEAGMLPALGRRAVVLNWSDRSRWRASLARAAFRHFGGDRAFNPLAVVFRPFRRTKVFRFWQPFRDWKDGRPGPLAALEREFFEATGLQPPRSSP